MGPVSARLYPHQPVQSTQPYKEQSNQSNQHCPEQSNQSNQPCPEQSNQSSQLYPQQVGQEMDSKNRPEGVGEMVADNAQLTQPGAAPPPVKKMDRIEGYQNFVNPNVQFVPPPPSYAESMKHQQPPPPPENFGQAFQMTPEEARRCLLQFVKRQRCWGESAAKTMVINKVQPTTAVHYVLRTFVEIRATDWQTEAYMNQSIDGPVNGVPPSPWDINIPPPQPFMDQDIFVEVPHTASVKICHNCQGMTMVVCYSCRGWGNWLCSSCSGSGFSYHTYNDRQRHSCYWCNGTGRRMCTSCHARGRTPCRTCDATGRIKYFIRLTAHFKTEVVDFIVERTDLPDHLIRNVNGVTLFEDTRPCVYPLRTFPVTEVNRQSEMLIQQHKTLSQNGRILMQYHVVRGVPVFQVDAVHKGKPLQYFVYGSDKQVYAPDYPQKSCCGCQVL